ncbi:MAG TPA: hypothetical protein VJN88_03755 [Ktedonobacterales bacterium]|nr:hypothetical protein [Ktedonobacterales bacterium]
MRRISVDFNTMTADELERVTLGQEGHSTGARLPSLCEGERVLLFDSELQVEGDVVVEHFPDGRRDWLAIPDWSTVVYTKPLAPSEIEASEAAS